MKLIVGYHSYKVAYKDHEFCLFNRDKEILYGPHYGAVGNYFIYFYKGTLVYYEKYPFLFREMIKIHL